MSEAGPLPEREPITVELDRNMQLNVMGACFNRYFGNDWAESEDAQKRFCPDVEGKSTLQAFIDQEPDWASTILPWERKVFEHYHPGLVFPEPTRW